MHRTYRGITRSGSTHRTDEPPATLRHLYAVTCMSCSRRIRRWFSVRRPWKLFITRQVARSESLSQGSSISAVLHWNNCVTKWKQKERSCRLRRKRNCCKDCQDWQKRVVAHRKIKRKPLHMTSLKNIHEIHGKCCITETKI